MAATVVSVVIFLCGVLVGRNARIQRAEAADTVADELPVAETRPPASAITTPGPDLTQAPPPPGPIDDPTDLTRLERERLLAEGATPVPAPAPAPTAGARDGNPSPAPPAAAPAAERAGATRPGTERAATERTTTARGRTPAAAASRSGTATAPAAGSGGYAVQLAALNTRGEADAMAKGMTAKGYQAYVQTPANGAPNVFRVRVGPFKTRREAEAAAGKLQKEEQFNPWIVRP